VDKAATRFIHAGTLRYVALLFRFSFLACGGPAVTMIVVVEASTPKSVTRLACEPGRVKRDAGEAIEDDQYGTRPAAQSLVRQIEATATFGFFLLTRYFQRDPILDTVRKRLPCVSFYGLLSFVAKYK
jgi:hypothetical protein